MLAAKVDEFGKAGWIAATVLGFWVFWPIGVALLLFLAFSGRIRAWRHEGPGRWYNTAEGQSGRGRGGWAWGGCGRGRGRFAPSGNTAFDEYRAETLRRLEEEQQEFQSYLERLRQAKDKAEFDQFMADRRNRREPEGGVPEASAG
ncbi:MAG TPA: DUF2852 domain-containing protein [Acetobacteraceae bacterium]|nr:DUF2852 domain-containing protein [Acetobacteraceae bacterium]